MSAEMQTLLYTAIAISFLHTLSGPDHYLPFIALSKSRGWGAGKTIGWTVVCGLGHVLSSVLLGLGGAALGWSVSKISFLEASRGNLSAWLLLLFGLIYTAWGMNRLKQNIAHKHFDLDEKGDLFVYDHRHGTAVNPRDRFKVTPWVMFIVFVLGPCEPMIPLLYFPAAQHSWWGMSVLILLYGFVTLLTMVLMVLLGYFGLLIPKSSFSEKYVHVLAGITILICGAGMLWLSW